MQKYHTTLVDEENMKIRLLLTRSVLTFFLCLTSLTASAVPVEELTQKYEEFLLSRLALAKKPPAQLSPFTTDGCSGGLSEGWRVLAKSLPLFRQRYGEKPPWEHCCVAHDRQYWRGEVEGGYQKRKNADLELKQCVIDTSRKATIQLVTSGKQNQQDVEKAFSVAAELMYTAVRAGGQPCSLFPWRWGYGWPMCPVFDNGDDQTEPHSVKSGSHEI